jgi:hypothetical protein
VGWRRSGQSRSVAALLLSTCALGILAIGGAGCESKGHANARLEKAVRAIPVPAGLVFAGLNQQSMDAGGGVTYEVDSKYSNPSMSCEQLQSAWVAAIVKAHLTTSEPVTANDRQIFVSGLGAKVGLQLGLVGDCTHPYVFGLSR